ncbi:MAG: hypothetical protein Dbin4_01990 [Alphaproteobacteria bacterium]|nr:hypothetical protein [Alphaproteobacteria bacterium]
MKHNISFTSANQEIRFAGLPIADKAIRRLIGWLTHPVAANRLQRQAAGSRHCCTASKHCARHGVNCPRFSPPAPE